MTTMAFGDVPLLDSATGRFPDDFAPPSVGADRAATEAARDAAESARDTATTQASTATTKAAAAETARAAAVVAQGLAEDARTAAAEQVAKADTALQPGDVTTAATGNKLVKRLSDGRAKAAAGTETDDVVTLGQAESVVAGKVGTGGALDEALSSTYETQVNAAATYARKVTVGAEMPAAASDPFATNSNGSTTTVPVAGGGRMVRWVAPRDTIIAAFILRISVASGNIDCAVYDEHLVRLGNVGSLPCPAAKAAALIQFPNAIHVYAGKSYWLYVGADNITAAFGTTGGYLYGALPVTSGMTANKFPAPERLNSMMDGIATMSGSTAFAVVPLLAPQRFLDVPALPASLFASSTGGIGGIGTPASAVAGQDPVSKRIFGRNGNTTLAYSDDSGVTITNAASFEATSEIPKAAVFAGNYIFLATAKGIGGRIWRGPRNGPYALANFTLVLDNQEGASLPWNLAAYDDGTVFVGNYRAPAAGALLVRKSTDFGATWAVVLDLGLDTRTVTDAAQTNGSTTLTSASAAFTATDVGKPITGSGIPVGTTIASVTNATTVLMSAASVGTVTNNTVVITRLAEHVHSVMRDANDPTKVYANVGDLGAKAGVYLSTNSGNSFTRKDQFGIIRLTSMTQVPEGILWGSDQYGCGGDLFLYDPAADTLQPRAVADPPFAGDVYGMLRDDDGLIWYFSKGMGQGDNRRGALWVTADGGLTSWLAADLGPGPTNNAVVLAKHGDTLVIGDGRRFNVAGVAEALL